MRIHLLLYGTTLVVTSFIAPAALGDPCEPWPCNVDVVPQNHMTYPRFIGAPCDLYGPPRYTCTIFITLYDYYWNPCPDIYARADNDPDY